MTAYEQLVARMREVVNLGRAEALLGWDQQVLMPPAAAEARGEVMQTIARIRHEMFTDDKTARLLEEAQAELDHATYESDEASLVRVVKQDYAEATRLPSEFVGELVKHQALSKDVWVAARANNAFRTFQPALERMLELKQREAEYLGYTDHPYDALIDQYERGITAAQVQTIFDEHKPHLVELIANIRQNADRVDGSILHRPYDVQKQESFEREIVAAFGFDFNRGLQATSVHPFASRQAGNDVRITTRFDPNYLSGSLFGMMHEAGHAMYEQGIPAYMDGLPIGFGTSLGVHESQSRMWENIVGRSRGFWEWAYPRLQATFPESLSDVDVETFYRSVNEVKPSFIRVEADEATYNLHIMLRFELEMDMIAGKVNISDLSEEWNERFEAAIGIAPASDTVGVLQDIHWSMGLMGYFATYALGNMLAAQYYRRALVDRPSIPDDIANGKFDTLLTWLQENIHAHGRKFTSDELTRRLTGEGIQSRYYTEYLQEKYGAIYGL